MIERNLKTFKTCRVNQTISIPLNRIKSDMRSLSATVVLGYFFFFTGSRLALGPTLSNGYQGALSLGLEWMGLEADHPPPYNPKA